LLKSDLAAMAHGLEVRTPFLDEEVFAVARRLPIHLRWRRGFWGRRSPKPLLKKQLSDCFSRSFRERPKCGFAPSAASWFGAGTPLGRRIDDILTSDDCRLRELFTLREPAALEPGTRWILFSLENWLRARSRLSFR
jgi:asparagine synthase (glutamine-hydrolysing)